MRRFGRIVLALCSSTVLVACTGDTGPAGPAGPTGATGQQGPKGDTGPAAAATGVIKGTVTDSVAKLALAGVAVTATDVGGKQLATATSDAQGGFSLTVPLGTVLVSFAATGYTSPTPLAIGALDGQDVAIAVALTEAKTGAPSVSVALPGNDIGFGATASLTATASSPTGATLTYKWSIATAPPLGSVQGNGAAATLTMPSMSDAFAPRVDSTNPNGFTSGYTLEDRFGIVPILPDTRGQVAVACVVSDDRGQSTTASITVNATSIQTGTHNVALGTRVYLNSGHTGASAWQLTVPTGSNAKLDDATSRTPSFVADLAGSYAATEGANTTTINAGKFKGAIGGAAAMGDGVVADSNCTACHNGTIAEDKFTPWTGTKHATKFSRGIDGDPTGTASPACFDCHTVGFDKGMQSGGFSDMMAEMNWSWPSVLQPGNWQAMWNDPNSAKVARLANIQCENCHGPQGDSGSTLHMATLVSGVLKPFTSPRISFAAELCANCHASGSGHHYYSEWSTTDPATGWGHSNRGMETLAASSTGLNGHCGRCHSAQGFVQYRANLKAGWNGNLTNTAGAPVSNNLSDITLANVQPVTCTACHDPHDATNPNQLRVYGDTDPLPSGFQVFGVGKGALCITCHNSRNGTYNPTPTTVATYLHEDSESYNAGNPTGYSAPHQACQGDVLAGRNAYFLGALTPMLSKHANVENACVGCHMELNPVAHSSHGSPATNTHTFRITDDTRDALCANCHSKNVGGEAIQAGTEAQLGKLGTKIASSVQAKMTAAGTVTVVYYDPATGFYSVKSGSTGQQLNLATNPIVSTSIVEVHGQIGFDIKLTNPVSVVEYDGSGNAQAAKNLGEFQVQLGSIKDAAGNVLYALSGNLVRAGWNYFLVEGDQSKGIHNPTFITQVLDNSLAKDLTN